MYNAKQRARLENLYLATLAHQHNAESVRRVQCPNYSAIKLDGCRLHDRIAVDDITRDGIARDVAGRLNISDTAPACEENENVDTMRHGPQQQTAAVELNAYPQESAEVSGGDDFARPAIKTRVPTRRPENQLRASSLNRTCRRVAFCETAAEGLLRVDSAYPMGR